MKSVAWKQIRDNNSLLQKFCDSKKPSLERVIALCADSDIHCFHPFIHDLPNVTAFEIALNNDHFYIVDYFMENQRFRKKLVQISEVGWNLPARILLLFLQKNDALRAKKFLSLVPNPIISHFTASACLSMNPLDMDLVYMLFQNNPKIVDSRNQRNQTPFFVAVEKKLFDIAALIIQECEFELSNHELNKALHLLRENNQDSLIQILNEKYPHAEQTPTNMNNSPRKLTNMLTKSRLIPNFNKILDLNVTLRNICGTQNPSLKKIEILCKKGASCFYTKTSLVVDKTVFELTLSKKHFYVVEYFLDNTRFQRELNNKEPSFIENILIRLMQNNQANLAKKILAVIDQPIQSNRSLNVCLEMETYDSELVGMLFQNNPEIAFLHEEDEKLPLFTAIDNEHYDVVLKFFENKAAAATHIQNSSIDDINEALLKLTGKPELIELFKNADPRINFNQAISLLLEQKTVDLQEIKQLLPPNSEIFKTDIMTLAVNYRHYNLVEYFLQNKNILAIMTPIAMGNAIRELIFHGQTELAKKFIDKCPNYEEKAMGHRNTYTGQSMLSLAFWQKSPDTDLIITLYNKNPNESDLKLLCLFTGDLVDENKSHIAISLLNNFFALHEMWNREAMTFFNRNLSWNYLQKRYFPIGLPLFNGDLLLAATRTNQMEIVDYLLTPWPGTTKNFLSRCTPNELAIATSYLIQHDQLDRAKTLIRNNPNTAISWANGSLLTSCTDKNIPDLELVRLLYVEPKPSAEFKRTPIIPRQKIPIILATIQPKDLTTDNLRILLKSFLADPRKKNSISQMYNASVDVTKIGVVNKIIELSTNKRITMTPHELHYLIKNKLVDNSFLKKIIHAFLEMPQLKGLKNAMDLCNNLSKSVDGQISITQSSCELVAKKYQCATSP